MQDDPLHQTLNHLYDAALDDDRWTPFLGAAARLLRSQWAMVWVHDFETSGADLSGNDGSLVAFDGADPAFLDSYGTHYSHVNVWAAAEHRLKPGIAVTSSMLFDDRQLDRTEFGADWLRPQDLFYAVGGVVSRTRSLAVKVSFLRSQRIGPYEADELQHYQRLLPHLQRALAMRQRLAALTQDRCWAHAALDTLPTGVLRADRHGFCLHANWAAEALLARRAAPLLRDALGRLQASSSASDRRLQALIRSACDRPATQPHGGPLRLPGTDGDWQVLVTTAPESDATAPASATVFVNGPAMQPAPLPERLTAFYGLTGAEARLVAALATGHTLKAHAERQSVSLHTVRAQLRSATAKVGVKRQADLVRAVLTGPVMLRPVGDDELGSHG